MSSFGFPILPDSCSASAWMVTLLDQGRVEPHLLTTDERLQRRIATEAWLRWKSHNTRWRLVARPVGVHVRRYQGDNWAGK